MMADTSPTLPWERITQFYHSTRKSIQLVCAYNADAAAASFTMTSLLKSSLIPFSVHPISAYDELQDIVDQANLAQDFARASDTDERVDELFLLVGLGAPVKLTNYFDLTRHVVIVLDAFRPYHLSNLRSTNTTRLVLWGSERIYDEVANFFRTQQASEVVRARRRRRRREAIAAAKLKRHRSDREEKRSANRRGRYVPGDDDFTSDDEDDASEEDDDVSESDLDSLSDDDEEEEDPEDAPISQSQDGVDWMRPDGVPSYLERLYYAAECAGRSCAVDAYELSVLLSRFKADYLWHAAVGICDLFRRRLIDYSTYLVEMRPLLDAVALQQSNKRGALEAFSDEAVNRRRPTSTAATTNSMQLHILNEEQLYLLRHSSLWNAIWYHPVLAGVLGLHHVDEGKDFLSQLLASRCGVSRERANKPWRDLPNEVRAKCAPHVLRELAHIIENKGTFVKYPIQIRCIGRTVGYSTEVSTFDACALFEAALAKASPASCYTVEGTPEDMASATAMVKTRLHEYRRAQFWAATSILDVDPNDKTFAAAVQEAFSLQESIASATGALMQPSMLQSTRMLHYAEPNDPTSSTSALESFSNVYRLGALANRLFCTVTAERGVGGYARELRPLLLSCTEPRPRFKAPDSTFSSPSFSGAGTLTSGPLVAAAGGSSSARNTGLSSGTLPSVSGEDIEYTVLLVHGGSVGASMATPIAAVGRFMECVRDEEEFAILPRQTLTQRGAVIVKGRESAVHVADVMQLRSLARWDPRRDEERAAQGGGERIARVEAGSDEEGDDVEEEAEEADHTDDDDVDELLLGEERYRVTGDGSDDDDE